MYLIIKYSSLAQSVEHSAVNRSVVGSSPTGGVSKACKFNFYGLFIILIFNRKKHLKDLTLSGAPSHSYVNIRIPSKLHTKNQSSILPIPALVMPSTY